MSRILYLDLTAGLAGDMLLAALLDLGASLEALSEQLDGLGFGPIPVQQRSTRRGPFAAQRFLVQDEEQPHCRTHREIAAVIEAAELPPRARERALSVFACLAEAEGKVHGQPPEEVHFHEVGALDSIADIVGGCLALEALDVGRLVAGTPPLGSGSIRTAHGSMSLPAPATLALLRGWPVRPAPGPGEWVTPTGAAFLSALATHGSLPAMTLLGTGYGAGSRKGGAVPNVLRALLGESPGASLPKDEVAVLETAIDDMNPEWLPSLGEALFQAGALDVQAVPALMKKGRSGLQLTVIAPGPQAEQVARALLVHSSSLGVRCRRESRWILPRRMLQVSTPYGVVRVKLAEPPGAPPRLTPEHEDCAALAREHGAY